MSEFPYMKLYVSDFLGDTTHLSTEEIGAYWLLLLAMWNAGGALPNDEKLLRRITRLPPRKWHQIGPVVMAFFDLNNGVLTNPRMQKEIQKATEKHAVLSRNAKTARRAKQLKNNEVPPANETPKTHHTIAIANKGSIQNPLSSSSPTVEEDTQASFFPDEPETEKPPEKKRVANGKAAPDVEAFKSEISKVLDPERVEALCAVRRKKGAVFSQRAGNLLLAALTACPSPAVAADEMVLRNWTSVKPEWLERSYGQPGRGPPTKSEFRRHQDQVQDELDRATGRNRNERSDHDDGKIVDLDEPNYHRTH